LFRVFESGSNPIGLSYGESRILGPIQNSVDLTVFGISRLAELQRLQGMELAFNQDHQALYIPQCWWN
jgi:hypothetical protein